MSSREQALKEIRACARKLLLSRVRAQWEALLPYWCWLSLATGAVILTLRYVGGLQGFLGNALFFLILLLGGVGITVIAKRRAGSRYDALLAWDEFCKSHDLFSNAWLLVQSPEKYDTPAARLHVRQALRQIKTLESKSSNEPKPKWEKWAIAAGMTTLIAMLLPWAPTLTLRPMVPVAESEILPARVVEEVATALETLARQDLQLENPSDDLATLVSKQQTQLSEVAEHLRRDPNPQALEAMEKLEAVASELERLSDTLQLEDTAWMSESLLVYFEQAALTRKFSVEVAQQALQPTHQEVQRLFEDFQQERGGQSQKLIPILKLAVDAQAEYEDQRWVGGHMVKLAQQLQQNLWEDAHKTFEALLDRIQQRMDKENNQKKLQALKESVRQQGSKLGGQADGPTYASDPSADGGSASDSIGGADALPNLPPEAMTSVPPETLPLPEGDLELKKQESVDAAVEKPPGQLPIKPRESREKKRAKFFAPIPGMSEEQSKNLSPNFAVEGQRQDDSPGQGEADLEFRETDLQAAKQVAELATKNGNAQRGEGELAQVEKRTLSKESSKLPPNAASEALKGRAERALDLSRIPMSQREVVQRYFLQRRESRPTDR